MTIRILPRSALLRRCALALALSALPFVHASSAEAASAIGTVAPDLAKALASVPKGALVIAAPLATDMPTTRGDELAVRVATQVAGKLEGARVHNAPLSLSAAHAAAAKSPAFVWVQTEVKKGELRVTVDAFPVVTNSWDRLRRISPPPLAHAFASRPADAEVRSFYPPVLLEQTKVHKARHGEGEVLAMACGDLDADGGLELALVTRNRVSVGRLRSGGYVVERAAPWATLAKRAPVPLREPLATAFFGLDGLLVGLSDRGGVRLDAALAPKDTLRGLPVSAAAGCASLLPEASAFDGMVLACVPPPAPPVAVPTKPAPAGKPTPAGKPKPPVEDGLVPPTTRFDAFAALDLVSKEGITSTVMAAREPGGKLRLRRGDVTQVLENVGAQMLLADLDLDGEPEIVFSQDTGDDALTVLTWTKNGFQQRLRVPAPTGIRAVAACPPEERGVPALALAVGATFSADPAKPGLPEVWLVR